MDQQPRGSLEMLPLDVKPNDPLLREPPTIRRATLGDTEWGEEA